MVELSLKCSFVCGLEKESNFNLFFFKDVFIYLLERQNDRDLPTAGHFANADDSHGDGPDQNQEPATPSGLLHR